jgi:hypothetical protein
LLVPGLAEHRRNPTTVPRIVGHPQDRKADYHPAIALTHAEAECL